MAELLENTGTQFDPEVVAAMVKVIAEAPAEPSTQDHIRAVLAGAQERERLGAASEA